MTRIDLHGKVWSEALAEFLDFYNRIVAITSTTPPTLDVVHGYGSTGAGGVLRQRLRAFLGKYPQCLEFSLGETLDGNPGHTLVTAKKALPDTGGLLAEHIWEYCDNPRTVGKIAGRFRRYGDPQVHQAIRTLQRQGRLTVVGKGRLREYAAV